MSLPQARMSQPRAPSKIPGPANRSSALSGPRDTLPREKLALYSASAVISFAYVFGFNFYSDAIRSALAGLLAAVTFLTFATGLRDGLKSSTRTIMILSALTMTVVALVTLISYRSVDDLIAFTRTFTGVLVMVWAISQTFYSKALSRLLLWMSVVAATACVLMPVLNDPVLRGGTLRMGSITASNDSLHPSAYICVVVSFWLATIAYHRRNPAFALASAFVFSMVFFYEARAAEVIAYYLFLMSIVSLFVSRRFNHYLSLVVPIAFILIVTMFFIILINNSQNFDVYTGSGRIGAWIDRFQRLGDRSWTELLFGMGPGSDFYYGTITWTSKATHSHNDFINVMLEFGVVGLISFLIVLIMMVYSAPIFLRYYITIIMIAPFFSGGLLFKTTVAPVMAFAIIHMQMMQREAQARRAAMPRKPRMPHGRRPALAPAYR